MKNNCVVLEYQEDFTDNFSVYAYGKIIEKKSGTPCFYENSSNKRIKFEAKMNNFNLDIKYICSNRVENITKKALAQNQKYIDCSKISKIKSKNTKGFINSNHFKIPDINLLDNKILDSFDFSTSSFLLNFDILEEINQEQSIGLYISDKDFQDNSIDWGFIYSATKRINKYIKKPKLYIFGPKQIKEFIKSEINFKIINNLNWKEEFYLLKECKHKIIISNRNSYSKNLWASILNKKYDGIRTYSKNEYSKNLNRNWLAI